MKRGGIQKRGSERGLEVEKGKKRAAAAIEKQTSPSAVVPGVLFSALLRSRASRGRMRTQRGL